MDRVVFVPEAHGRLGAPVALTLADAGYTVYAGVPRALHGTGDADHLDRYAAEHPERLRVVEADPRDQNSVDGAVRGIAEEAGRVDLVVHTVERFALGPVESFTPYQLGELHDAGVLTSQRVNRAVLPGMRARGEGTLVWVVWSVPDEISARRAAYAASAAAVTRLALGYAAELSPFGIGAHVVTVPLGDPSALSPVLPDDTRTHRAYPRAAEAPGATGAAGAAARAAGGGALAQAVLSLLGTPAAERPFRTDAPERIESGTAQEDRRS